MAQAVAVAEASSAAEVRKALVRELRAERDEVGDVDLPRAGRAITRIQARALAAAHRMPELMDADRNGVTKLEVEVMRAVAEVMLRVYWPHVARMWAMGAGRTVPKSVKSVDALDYDDLLALYDSVHARLTREAVTNAAWRIATVTLTAARKVPRA